MSKENENALIGFSGFVGSTLLKQAKFDHLYRSTNISEIKNKSFNLVVCAGAPAQKWLANRDPHADNLKILNLIDQLSTIKAQKFILISTVDVFKNPVSVNEETPIDENGLNAYGFNRRLLEKFVENQFSESLIIRLPGLVGPGLRKNIIFDFLNNNNLNLIDSRAVFQFYPMVNLWSDIQIALNEKLNLLHLTSSPISAEEVSNLGFGRLFNNILDSKPAVYDFQTCHSHIFGKNGNYQYDKSETLLAIRSYAQSEPNSKMDVK